MATIHKFPDAPARAPARSAPAAPVTSVVEMPGRYVRPLHRRHMAQAARDDGMMAALADERPDLGEMLASSWRRERRRRIVVAAIWIVCIAYCIAIWTGYAR